LSSHALRCYMASMTGEDILAPLHGAPCINLRTFRKDGTPVDTPLWVVVIDGRPHSYTDGRSHKIKRLRRNPRVEVAASDVWGICSTPWYPAVCRFVEEGAARDRVFSAIATKYGLNWTMAQWGSLLTGRAKHRVVMELELGASPVSLGPD
jgi:PPOX class probable F420-dependent enzyme